MNTLTAQSEANRWQGAIASMLSYSRSHLELTILLTKPGKKQNLHLVCGDCRYICGPVSWGNASIRIKHRKADLATGEIAVTDKAAGFTVFCNGVRMIRNVEPIY